VPRWRFPNAFTADSGEDALHEPERGWRAAWDRNIDWNHIRDATITGVAFPEDASGARPIRPTLDVYQSEKPEGCCIRNALTAIDGGSVDGVRVDGVSGERHASLVKMRGNRYRIHSGPRRGGRTWRGERAAR